MRLTTELQLAGENLLVDVIELEKRLQQANLLPGLEIPDDLSDWPQPLQDIVDYIEEIEGELTTIKTKINAIYARQLI